MNERPVVFVTVQLPKEFVRELEENCHVTMWESDSAISEHDVIDKVRRLKPSAIFLTPLTSVNTDLLVAAGKP